VTLEKPTRGKPVKEGFLLFRASDKNPKGNRVCTQRAGTHQFNMWIDHKIKLLLLFIKTKLLNSSCG
jgi:hypothetical protein